jgi:hypothetical protein
MYDVLSRHGILTIFEVAISTARKQPGKVDLAAPDYDVMDSI